MKRKYSVNVFSEEREEKKEEGSREETIEEIHRIIDEEIVWRNNDMWR